MNRIKNYFIDNAWLISLVMATLLFRLPGIFRPETIGDEGKAVAIIQKPWGQFIDQLIYLDAHPPLYFCFIKWWGTMSRDLWFLRMFSIMLSVLTCIVLFKLTRRLFNKTAAIITAYLFTISPQLVFVFQYLRPYALATFFFSVFLYLAVLFMHAGSFRKAAVLGICLGAISFLLAYTFYLSVFILFAFALVAVKILFKDKKKLWLFLSSQALALLLYVHWLPILQAQTRELYAGTGGSNPLLHAERIGFYAGRLHVGNFCKLCAGLLQFEDIIGHSRRFSERLPAFWLFFITGAAILFCVYILAASMKHISKNERYKNTGQLLLGTLMLSVFFISLKLVAGDYGIGFPVHMNMRYLCQLSIIVLIIMGVLLAALSRAKRTLILTGISLFYIAQVLYINSYPMNMYRAAFAFLKGKNVDTIIACPQSPSWIAYVDKEQEIEKRVNIIECRDEATEKNTLKRVSLLDEVCVYYLNKAENTIRFTGIYEDLLTELHTMGFVEQDAKNINDLIVLKYLVRRTRS
ncbi:MAG: glycosyltransferase family 39 protein [Candidatus Omnitrophica bacterium]|nr:glycosyltransferase family 39 protein [Candidatus Omnitrophota bacterium]